LLQAKGNQRTPPTHTRAQEGNFAVSDSHTRRAEPAFMICRTEVVELLPGRRWPSRGSRWEILREIPPASLRPRASRTAPGGVHVFHGRQEFPLECRGP